MKFFESLLHFVFPRRSNNHRAKILHVSSIVLVILSLISFQFLLSYLPKTGVNILGYAANISTSEVIALTNQKRIEAGVAALNYNPSLAQAALSKGNHMLANQYWAHIAPDGTEPWKFFTDVGYRYRYAGENLARDFSNPSSIVDAWMASPTHRDNLLSNKYSDIGVAVVEGPLNGVDTTIIVQFFGSPLGETQAVQVQAKPIVTATPIPTPLVTTQPAELINVTPTVIVTPTLTPLLIESNEQIDTLPPSETEASNLGILLSPFQTTRGISILITSVLMVVFVIDLIVVTRRRIPRTNSRTLAHIAFLGMILSIVIMTQVGRIL